MKITNIKYSVESAVEGLVRNRLMSIASIITVSSCIFIFILSFCVASNLDIWLEKIEKSIDFNVFIDDIVSSNDFNTLNDGIRQIKNVERVEIVSKQEAFEKMKKQLGEDLLVGLEKNNPFPRTIQVYLNDIKNQAYVVTQVKLLKDSIEKKYKPNTNAKDDDKIIRITYTDTSNLVKLNELIRVWSIIAICSMVFLSIVIIVNTIKITINNREREISIMKYIGATDAFIRWPFVIEGIIIGTIGAIIPIFIGWLGYSEILEILKSDITISYLIKSNLALRPVIDVFIFVSPVSLAMGILIGIVGSITSMHRLLRA